MQASKDVPNDVSDKYINLYNYEYGSNNILISKNSTSFTYDDNRSFEVKFVPRFASDNATLCFNLNLSYLDVSKVLNITYPVKSSLIKITFIAKGERGDEWVDFLIVSNNSQVNPSRILSQKWIEYSFYVYNAYPIEYICLKFNAEKNPVGATIFLKDIKIGLAKSIDPSQNTRNRNVFA
jgi:hypothetical protein